MRKILLIIFVFNLFAFNTFSQTGKLIESANILLQKEEFKAYRGWIKYLIYDVQVVALRQGNANNQIKKKEERLAYWLQEIKKNPNAFNLLRGKQEWAYESPVDGSGQPFMINIPQDYSNDKAMPLSVYMHGYSGNHIEHFNSNDSIAGMFEVSVLGRSRAGGFVGVSEADVLHVIDYVEENWNIDKDRIHVLGGSMGGHGAFRLANRYPYRFASARITCGFASDKPFKNFLTIPIYATHSNDDYNVPIIHASGPLDRIREYGGQVILDSTSGFGHAVWDYEEGNNRANIWFKKQVRPNTKDIKYINFTALDGGGMRNWWAEIEEWGNKIEPAKFVLSVNDNNILYANLTNIKQLKLFLDESPIDASKPLSVSINGAPPILKIKNPLPNKALLKKTDNGWIISLKTDSTGIRRHTPGGPNLLYNGSPLLIVYGTKGTKEEREAMLNTAKAASLSSDARWKKPNGDVAKDGTYMNYNLYGELSIKADSLVNKEDIKRCNLVLIGTKDQNNIVASIADSLPVKVTKERITFLEGESYSANKNGLGLVYYNPDSPQNLIFWVASNNSKLYRAGSPIPELMTFTFPFYASSTPGFDCLISLVDQPSIVTTRRFDSKWNWISSDTNKEIIADSIIENKNYYKALSNAVKLETSTDFAFVAKPEGYNVDGISFQSGVTQIKDLVAKYFYEPIGIITISGNELLEVQLKLKENELSMYPEPIIKEIIPHKNYTLAVNQYSIWTLVEKTKHIFTNYRLTDTQLSDAITRFLPRNN